MNIAPYIRTDAELAHQAAYESREASLHGSASRIHYRILESSPPNDPVKRKVAWRVVRNEKEMSRWFYRRVEAVDYVKDQTRRDADAAKRLGVHVHLTVGR